MTGSQLGQMYDRRRYLLFAFAAATALLGCKASTQNQPDPTPVYRAILDTLQASFHGTQRRPVLDPSLKLGEARGYLGRVGAGSDLARAFAKANAVEARLPEAVTRALGLDVVAVDSLPLDRNSLDAVSDRLGFSAYVVYLSRPAYSKGGDTAVMAYAFGCGSLCGEGHVARLERRGTGWVIVADYMYVIS